MMMTRVALVALVLMMMVGCASTGGGPRGVAPKDFTLEMSMRGTGNRFTWFELGKDNVLGFAGGQSAKFRDALFEMTLTADQVDAAWELIRDEGLLTARSTKGEMTDAEYRLKIRGGGGNSIRTIDDSVPGVVKLHDLLFSYQAEERYDIPGLGGKR